VRGRAPLRTGGFTLIELLVAITIVSFLGLAIYNVFYQGVNIWNRAVKEDPEIDFEFFYDKLALELRNVSPYKTPSLVGKGDSIEFFTLTPGNRLEGHEIESSNRVPSKVTYSFDAPRKAIRRKEEDYHEILNDRTKTDTQGRVVATDVSRVTLQYFSSGKWNRGLQWRNSWQRECLPDAVQAKIEFGTDSTEAVTRIIPLASMRCQG
jgi:prepilin-type N-terminal cleavage/methylation domain-containing protein